MDLSTLRTIIQQESPVRLEVGTVTSVDPRGTRTVSVRLSGGHVNTRVKTCVDGLQIGDQVLVARLAQVAQVIVIGQLLSDVNPVLARRGILAPPNNLTVDPVPAAIVVRWDTYPGEDVCWEVRYNTSATDTGATDILVTRGSYYIHYVVDASGDMAAAATYHFKVRSLRWLGDNNVMYSAWSAWDSATSGGHNLRDIVELEFASQTELTISGGHVTRTQVYHSIDTEGDAASDDLTHIDGGVEGDVIVIRPASDSRTVVLKHGSGNIWLFRKADVTLDDLLDHIMLIYTASGWWCDIGAALLGGGAAGDLSDLLDVSSEAPDNKDVLAWNQSAFQWEPEALDTTYLTDVDTVTDPPALNEVLKWNGLDWVPAAYDYSFVFSIASFTDNESTPQLIGSGTWRGIGALTFDMTYNNGPPTAAEIQLTSDGGVSWGSPLTVTTPFLTATSTETTAYPSAKDKYIRFTLDADKGAENDTDQVEVMFRNWVAYGVSTKASGYTSADVNGLGTKLVSNDYTISVAVAPGASEYIIFAYPNSYSALHATGVLFNSITCPMQSPEVVSVTNTAGHTEDFKVYRSTLANLGSHTLVTSTTSNLTNLIYWGKTTKTSGYTEADIEGLATSVASNDATRTFTVTTGAGEYIAYSYPTRLGTVTFWVGGFEGGFEDPETVSVTNSNGYTENYYIYRSTNANLGETEVTTT